MLINGIEAFELCRDGVSPTFRFGKDACTARRRFTVPWENFGKAIKALRGECTVSSDKQSFVRVSPYQFYWQNMDRMFTCTDVSEGFGVGMPRIDGHVYPLVSPPYTGKIDTSTSTGLDIQTASLVIDSNDVGHPGMANITADFEIVNYAIYEDDEVDNPINPVLLELPAEWDRYTVWSADFSSQLINVPQGAYQYYNTKAQVPIPIRIPVAEAKISATIYGLALVPPAALMYNGAVNATDFSFYFQPRDGNGVSATTFFTCAAETLLFLYAKASPRMTGTGLVTNDVTLQFSYRQYGHNTAPHYDPKTKKVNFDRICVNPTSITTAKADKSAPFRLRNFGYFWTPIVPLST